VAGSNGDLLLGLAGLPMRDTSSRGHSIETSASVTATLDNMGFLPGTTTNSHLS